MGISDHISQSAGEQVADLNVPIKATDRHNVVSTDSAASLLGSSPVTTQIRFSIYIAVIRIVLVLSSVKLLFNGAIHHTTNEISSTFENPYTIDVKGTFIVFESYCVLFRGRG